MEIVAVDIGGTHARFAIAEVQEGRVARLAPEITLKTADHASFPAAWEEFAARTGRPLPRAAGIAFAGPAEGEVLKLTNNHWTLRPASIARELDLEDFTLVNDFAAVAHAVAQLDSSHFRGVCGPPGPLPASGVVSIIGPGTGLGVAQVVRTDGSYRAIATEGGHIDFAPLDGIEDQLLQFLRQRYGRVSVERLVSGPGLANIHAALASIEGRTIQSADEKALWMAALTGADTHAVAALARFCMSLGSVAGDVALAQGAHAVVIAGGLGLRLAEHLTQSGFGQRFVAKGRFEPRMATLPVKLVVHPQPGLYGAAAAFAQANQARSSHV